MHLSSWLINDIFCYSLFNLFTEKSQALQDAGIAAMIILGFITLIGAVIGILFCINKVRQQRRNGYAGINYDGNDLVDPAVPAHPDDPNDPNAWSASK